jgi:hypothetical protein
VKRRLIQGKLETGSFFGPSHHSANIGSDLPIYGSIASDVRFYHREAKNYKSLSIKNLMERWK